MSYLLHYVIRLSLCAYYIAITYTTIRLNNCVSTRGVQVTVTTTSSQYQPIEFYRNIYYA